MALGASPQPVAPTPGAIEALSALLRSDLDAVDALIHQRMGSSVGLIPNLAAYILDSGGKRIRPKVTLACARLYGRGEDAARRLAAAVEFIHTATLLHDDVVDGGAMRRGRAAANLVWGNSASVLVGDFLFARAFQLMVEAGDVEVLDVLAGAASTIAEGEVMQLSAMNDAETSLSQYLQIIEAKTAALFAAAAQSGGMAAGLSRAEAEPLYAFGRNIGLAFQLVDDALDYGGAPAETGKLSGADFREGKVTMPVVIAREAGDAAERAFWREAMSGGEGAARDFEAALVILRRRNALSKTLDAARAYRDAAKDALSAAPAGPFRDVLMDLADFVVERAG